MKRERGRDRRVFTFGPPNGFTERRVKAGRRKLDALQVSVQQFEVLMSALGYRESRPGKML